VSTVNARQGLPCWMNLCLAVDMKSFISWV